MSAFDEWREKVEREPIETDISDYGDEWCAGFLAGQANLLRALEAAGWRLVYPDDFPGLCQRCKNPIEEGTVHRMFNGNQMFACAIERVETF